MSSCGSLINGIEPEDVTAWTLDIETQMLQEEILKLKENPTDANVKQIEDKEKSIAEKKIALDKHCRHFGLKYGKYGTEENGVKSDTTNGEAGAMTNGNVEHVPASADINMGDASAVTFDAAADAAASAALDEIQFPQPTAPDMANGFDMHDDTGMMATSYNAVTGVDINDPFVNHGGHATTDFFHTPTGTYTDAFAGLPAADYIPAFNSNNSLKSLPKQSMPRTDSDGKPIIDVDDYLRIRDGVIPTNYGTSDGNAGGHGMDFGGGDQMDMDTLAHQSPGTENLESVISGMDKYNNS